MSTYYAYGIDLSKDYFKFKKNAAELLWNKAKTIDWVQEAYADYCEDNDLDPDGGFYDEFIDDYENDTTYNSGIEAFLADVINEFVDPVEKPFIMDDYILAVPATLPVNDSEKVVMLTQQRIREILADYVNPLVEKPVVVDWYTIEE